MSRVLLLEAAGPESGALAAAAATRGDQVYAVTDPATHATYTRDLSSLLTDALTVDFTRPDQAVGDIIGFARRIGAEAVLTANDYLTDLTAHVCDALGAPGNDPHRAYAARSKAAMHAAFTAHGVAAPTTRIVDDAEMLRNLLAHGQIEFPCVVKPADAAGSDGVTLVHDPSGLPEAWRAAVGAGGMYGLPRDSRMLVQDYVAGTEYSVETLTHHGVTEYLAITAKTMVTVQADATSAHRVETGHGLPAQLSPQLDQAVREQVDRAITATGIRNGAAHTEVFVTPSGDVIVLEIGARLAAGHIGFLLHHALGLDVWTALLDTALGRPAVLTPTRRRYAAIRYVTAPHPGRLRAVHGFPPTSTNVPVVHLRRTVGDHVDTGPANRARLGYVLVTGPDAAAVDTRATHLLDGITVDVEPTGDRP